MAFTPSVPTLSMGDITASINAFQTIGTHNNLAVYSDDITETALVLEETLGDAAVLIVGGENPALSQDEVVAAFEEAGNILIVQVDGLNSTNFSECIEAAIFDSIQYRPVNRKDETAVVFVFSPDARLTPVLGNRLVHLVAA